jgi:hypothetical protein
MLMAPTAIWNVLPLATEIGWPLKFPNQVRVPALLVRSIDTIDQAPPDEFVHDSADDAGRVTAEPADEAVELAGTAVPPVVYPPPLAISVPAAEADEAVELSRTFIAVPPTALNDPGAPLVPVGVVALRMFDTMVWSIAAIVLLLKFFAHVAGHFEEHAGTRVHDVAVRVEHDPAGRFRLHAVSGHYEKLYIAKVAVMVRLLFAP